MAHRVAESLEPHVATAQAARAGRIRAAVVDLYVRAARSWSRAPAEIARGLRDARHLHSRERRFVSEAVHALVRLRRRLAFVGGLDTSALGAPLPDALYLLWLAGAGQDRPPASEPLVVFDELARLGVPRDLVDRGAERLATVADPVARRALTYSFPDWLVARLTDDLGEARIDAFLAASNRRAPLCARANRLRTDRDALARRLAEEGMPSEPDPLARDGLVLLAQRNAYALPAFRDGWFELQDTASQLVGETVAPPPRGRVLDLCAGAGGKTLHLAALLGGAGRLLATDVSADKLAELRKRVRRAGATNVEVRRIEAAAPLAASESFDRVLVDAPCTGIGVLRRNPEARWRLGAEDLVELPRLQAELLRRAAAVVRPGGRLIYATCSVMRVENDAVVDGFLEETPGFEQVLLKEILGSDRAGVLGDGVRLRTAPDLQGTDGFFAAVLRRAR